MEEIKLQKAEGKAEKKPALPPKAPKQPEYEIVRGKNVLIQCPRGRLRGGDPVVPSDVGGSAVFDGLLRSGTIVRKS